MSFTRCITGNGLTCMEFEDTFEWFKRANLLIFTPEHKPMMSEIPKPEEPAHEIDRRIYVLSEYIRAAEFKMDPLFLQRSTFSLKLNEVTLYDDILFPAFTETNKTSFFSIEKIQSRKRDLLLSQEGEIMFEATLELSPVKGIYVRERTSILVLGGVIVGVALLMYYIIEFLFELVKATQGNSALQGLLWGLYQTRRIKRISLASKSKSSVGGRGHNLLGTVS